MRQRPGLEVKQERPDGLDAVIFRLVGKVTGTPECYEFLEEVRDAIHAGHRVILLDLERVDKMSSPGIGILAASYTSATHAGSRLGLVAVPEPVAALLRIVCLWDLLPRYATREEALIAMAQPR